MDEVRDLEVPVIDIPPDDRISEEDLVQAGVSLDATEGDGGLEVEGQAGVSLDATEGDGGLEVEGQAGVSLDATEGDGGLQVEGQAGICLDATDGDGGLEVGSRADEIRDARIEDVVDGEIVEEKDELIQGTSEKILGKRVRDAEVEEVEGIFLDSLPNIVEGEKREVPSIVDGEEREAERASVPKRLKTDIQATETEIISDDSEIKEQKELVDPSIANTESPTVKLGPKLFHSPIEMFMYFYELLHGWVANNDFNKYEFMVLSDLLVKGHRDPGSKIGSGIKAFQIRFHPGWHSRCYYLVRSDGSADDFSYRKCVDRLMPLPENLFSPSGDLIVEKIFDSSSKKHGSGKPGRHKDSGDGSHGGFHGSKGRGYGGGRFGGGGGRRGRGRGRW